MKLMDGLTNIINRLANRRNPQNNNVITRCSRLSDSEARAMFISGLGSKIIRIKTGYALNDTLQFKNEADELFYKKHLERTVNKASKFMLGFGRGIIVINEIGADLEKPISANPDFTNVKLDAFSGDMVTVLSPSLDLSNIRYMRPQYYVVRGHSFHHTRVIDFNYVMPSEEDLPTYRYGGVSEFELIRAQFVNDGIVERASARIVDINANMFHKIKGFKDLMKTGQDDFVVQYVSALADLRGIYGDGIIDAEDDVINVAQTLTNLADVDQITLRRLAMVTGIPLPILIGENVKGLNSAGDNERLVFQDMIETLQFDHLIDPIVSLCKIFKIEDVEFKENQGGTANERMDFETKVIDNAVKLSTLGEDYEEYLQRNNVTKKDDFSSWLPEEEKTIDTDINTEKTNGQPASQPSETLNGAQVTAILEIANRISIGEISKETAAKIMATSFPVTEREAMNIIGGIEIKGAPVDEA